MGNYHCTTDLLFLSGFSCFAFVELTTVLLVWSNPNLSNRRSIILTLKLVFSGSSICFDSHFTIGWIITGLFSSLSPGFELGSSQNVEGHYNTTQICPKRSRSSLQLNDNLDQCRLVAQRVAI